MNDTAARRKIKQYLIYKNGHKCSICGIETWNNLPVPLVCDHIDGNYENRDISNFRNVCCNCDAQLPTYKSKNKSKGDRYNREYYRRKN